MADEIDPEIAALLGGIEEYTPKAGSKIPPKSADGLQAGLRGPSFETLFGDMNVSGEVHQRGEFNIDLTKKAFDPIADFQESAPNIFYEDPQYYQKALANEGDEAQRFHETLKKFLSATDPKDRSLFRQQVAVTFWNLFSRMVPRLVSATPIQAKQLFARFGMALPTMLLPEQREIFSKIIYKKTRKDPVYYLDEWLRYIALGSIPPSGTDEVRTSQSDERTRINNLLQKALGKRDTAEAVLKARADERKSLESMLRERIDLICEHASMPGFLHVPSPYTETQKKTMTEISEIFRRLNSADKELVNSAETFQDASKDVDTIKDKMGSLGEESTKANLQILNQEFETVRQMVKMCVGRQGNHFPLLIKDYYHLSFRELGARENVIDLMTWLESIDAQVYCRPHKNMLNRIEPFVVLLPCYGDTGICWEPFDRYNRHTSRSRLAIPMYPKNLKMALVSAVGDMRWQGAKEKASHYWMQEGLTGQYYQWFIGQKLKGDVKEYFIQDYISWVTKESEGIQKLDKEVRSIFWRLIPFQQAIKEKLRDRSLLYQELYQRDVNKTMSDGY